MAIKFVDETFRPRVQTVRIIKGRIENGMAAFVCVFNGQQANLNRSTASDNFHDHSVIMVQKVFST